MEVDIAAALAPVELAVVQAAQQASMARLRESSIVCRPKCAACCKRAIVLTVAEAAVIVRRLLAIGKWPQAQRAAEAVRDIAAAANPQAWYKMGIDCPLLKDGLCMAYAVRPVACAAHFVTSDPAACDNTTAMPRAYMPHHMPEVHAQFIVALEAALAPGSVLRLSAPLPLTLLFAEKLLSRRFRDLEELAAAAAEGLSR